MKGLVCNCYHKDTFLVENDVVKPLLVGASKNNDSALSMLLDNTGVNISEKNELYCEITGLYWMWKNQKDYDYLGLLHYRRYLVCNNEIEELYHHNDIYKSADISLDIFGLNKENLDRLMNEYDILLPNYDDTRRQGYENLYEQYQGSKDHHIDHLELALTYLCEKYPDYKEHVSGVIKSPFVLFTNMFIMKNRIFDNYCAWLFPILEYVESKINVQGLNQQERRFIGYLSERLFTIYFTKEIQDRGYKVKFVNRIIFQHDPDIEKKSKENESKIVIFGTGQKAASYLRNSLREYISNYSSKVAYFVDNNINKQGQKWLGVDIKKPESLINESKYTKIVICSMYYEDILTQLGDLIDINHFEIEIYK